MLLLAGCSGQRVVQEGSAAITTVQSLPAMGERKRLAIAPLLDRTGDGKGSRISAQIGLLTGDDSRVRARDILSGMRDLLTTALFNRGGFIVLEREGLDEVLTEQAFAADDKVLGIGQRQTLEGADLLLFGAVTAFDMGESGGLAFPVPIPLGDRGDVGILDVEMRTAYVAMDLRLVDVASGRMVATTAVQGRARKFGIGLAGIFTAHGGHIRLPGLLSLFANTPIEQAMLEMAEAAGAQITAAAYPAPRAAPRAQEDKLWQTLP
jgi:curli biogenesis system outer membrane secretion channel CsgG